MSTLFFRTETTAIPRMRKKPEDPTQPRIMQLSALLVDGSRRERASMCVLFRPDQWVASGEAAAANGIDIQMCEKYGVRAQGALGVFIDMVRTTKELAAFNLEFHSFMIAIELHRAGNKKNESWERPGILRTCVSNRAATIANRGKTMKLEAAHEAMVEQPFVQRQNVLDDLRAVARIHFACIDRSY
jgi:hypothetical protein